MPLYEYQCKKCGFRFEKLQKFSDPPPAKCPECGGKITQLLSAPAVQFKGTGWYVTDYARKSTAPADGHSKSPEKPAEKGAPAKSESSGKSETSGKTKDKK